MSLLRTFALSVAFCLMGSGCGGLTQIQDTVTKFDQGAHTVSTTQIAFLKSAQAADCNFAFFQNSLAYSNAPVPEPHIPLKLVGTCESQLVTANSLKIRQRLLDAITLYADQIQAVASTGSDKALADNAQKTAGTLNDLASKAQLIGQTDGTGKPVVTAVEAAVIGITQMVLSSAQLKDIKASAKAQSANLKLVVDHLKEENTQLAIAMESRAGYVADTFTSVIGSVKKDGILKADGPTALHWSNNNEVYLMIVSARQMLLNTPPSGVGMLAAGSSAQDPVTVASQLNATLDSLVNANDAIANAGTGGIIAAVSDLVARAQAAQTMQAALAK